MANQEVISKYLPRDQVEIAEIRAVALEAQQLVRVNQIDRVIIPHWWELPKPRQTAIRLSATEKMIGVSEDRLLSSLSKVLKTILSDPRLWPEALPLVIETNLQSYGQKDTTQRIRVLSDDESEAMLIPLEDGRFAMLFSSITHNTLVSNYTQRFQPQEGYEIIRDRLGLLIDPSSKDNTITPFVLQRKTEDPTQIILDPQPDLPQPTMQLRAKIIHTLSSGSIFLHSSIGGFKIQRTSFCPNPAVS